jgi:sarcosine oxidase delta subunit
MKCPYCGKDLKVGAEFTGKAPFEIMVDVVCDTEECRVEFWTYVDLRQFTAGMGEEILKAVKQ